MSESEDPSTIAGIASAAAPPVSLTVEEFTKMKEPAELQLLLNCDICSKTFPRSQHFLLSTHKKIAHEGYLYHCGHCSATFPKKQEAKNHSMKIHISPSTGYPLPLKVKLSKKPKGIAKKGDDIIDQVQDLDSLKSNATATAEEQIILTTIKTEPEPNSTSTSAPETEAAASAELPFDAIQEDVKLFSSHLEIPPPQQMTGSTSSSSSTSTTKEINCYQKKGDFMRVMAMSTKKWHECDTCGKAWRNRSSAKRHMMVIHEGFRFKCGYCTATYKDKSSVRKHQIKNHRQEVEQTSSGTLTIPPYKIETVKKKVTDHTDEAEAELPKKKKKKKKNKQNKKKTVTVTPPPQQPPPLPLRLQCELCTNSSVFTSKHGLRYHVRIQHEKLRYKCGYCQEIFRQSYYLRSHISRNHLQQKKRKQQQLIEDNNSAEEFKFSVIKLIEDGDGEAYHQAVEDSSSISSSALAPSF